MKKIFSFLVIMVVAMSSVTFAETVKESLERQRKAADANRAKLAVYAATVEAVRAGQLIGLTSGKITKAAAKLAEGNQVYGTSYREVKMGDNTATLSRKEGVIKLTIDVEASWKVDDDTSGYHSEGDPVGAMITWVIMAKKFGIVFYKDKTEVIHSAPASWGTIVYGNYEITSVMFDYNIEPAISFSSNDKAKTEALKEIIKSHGKNGVLSRVAVKQWHRKATKQIKELQRKKDRGYIVFADGRFQFAKRM